MDITLLKSYILQNLLEKKELDSDYIRELTTELINRKAKINSINGFKIKNLCEVIRLMKEDKRDLFVFKDIYINQEIYYKILEFIMFENYKADEDELIQFLELLLKERDDFYTVEKSKQIIDYIQYKKDAKKGIYQVTKRVSSLRKFDIIEAFYTLPIYSPIDRMKILRQIESKGYGNELDLFSHPYIQVHLNLSHINSKEGDISKNINLLNANYSQLSDYTKKELTPLLGSKNIKDYIKSKLIDQDSLSQFEEAWDFVLDLDKFKKKEEMLLEENKEKAILKFIKENKGNLFKNIFRVVVDVEPIQYTKFSFNLDDRNIVIKKETKEVHRSIHCYKEILDTIRNNSYKSKEVKALYLDFIDSVEMDLSSIIEGRNDLNNLLLMQYTIKIKHERESLSRVELKNYLEVMSFEELRDEEFLFKDSKRVLEQIDYTNLSELIVLNKIYPLLQMTEDEKVFNIISCYKKHNGEEYKVLSALLKTDENIVNLLLNVKE